MSIDPECGCFRCGECGEVACEVTFCANHHAGDDADTGRCAEHVPA